MRTKLNDTTKMFPKDLSLMDMKITRTFMNKPIYLGLLKLGISKIVMHEFWYDYAKVKYEEKAKLC